LYEFEYPVTKILDIHEDCVVGNHYHKLRKETFVLVSGSGVATMGGQNFPLTLFEAVEAGEGLEHSFELKRGSVLIEFSNKKYDPTDDYKT
jgi:mannose-6-phosphate isomerase-like protein (cupin superfamily)